MFKTMARHGKGEATRAHVLAAALKLFRKRGFERTTMRDIAEAAGLSLGAAYHYFRSKEAIVEAYYEWMQSEHERLYQAAVPPNADLEARLRTLLETKLDLLRRDRKLLGALFGNLGDPSAPLSMFGKKTAALRERSVAQFVALFDEQGTSEELREFLGHGLWLAHLGVFLFFIHDGSPKQLRTRKLVEALVELAGRGVPLLGHPLAGPMRGRLLELMQDLGPRRGAS
jgi:AcrR family transcriptional regulator